MTAQVSISNKGDFLRKFMENIVREADVDSHGHATIHSGHFMVSCVHEDVDEADSLQASNKEEAEAPHGGYNFENAQKEPSDSYQFGARSTNQLSIDASLATLFEHMTLVYSGKISSPKWKDFKGIKVKLKDKIRLNNIIWREWHMQYIKRQRPVVCQFEAPISERMHSKPEAVVLEGKYSKRRLECLTTEYRKWRLFFKDRLSSCRKYGFEGGIKEELQLHSDFEKSSNKRAGMPYAPNRLDEENMLIGYDCLPNFSDDTLFSSLNPPFAFPDPKEIAQLGFADIIQPNLLQLQPSLDEVMDTLPPLPVLNDFRDFNRGISDRSGSRKIGDASLTFDMLIGESEYSYGSSEQHQQLAPGSCLTNQQSTSNDAFLIDQLKQQLMEAGPVSMETSFNDILVGRNAGKPLANSSDPRNRGRDPYLVQTGGVEGRRICNERAVAQNDLERRRASDQFPVFSSNVQYETLFADLQGQQRVTDLPCGFTQDSSGGIPGVLQTDLSNLLSYQLLQTNQQPQAVMMFPECVSSQDKSTSQWQPAPLLSYSSQSSLCAEQTKCAQQRVTELVNQSQAAINHNESRRGSTGSMQHGKGKKHVTFIVPQQPRTKPRTLAPAPVFSDTAAKGPGIMMDSSARGKSGPNCEKGTILARLLTQGNPARPSSRSPEASFSESSSCPALASKKLPRRNSPCQQQQQQLLFQQQSSFIPNQSVNSLASDVSTTATQPPQNYLRRPTSVNDFQKNLLIAAANQAFGVNSSQQVTVSLFDDMMSSAGLCPPPSSPLPATTVPSVATRPTKNRSRNPSNESNASVNDESGFPSEHQREHRRAHHISAEQKRRSNIKCGFEVLNQMVPELHAISSSKINKATTLQKAAECCRRMKSERQAMQAEASELHRQIDELQAEISACQAQLPATGVPVVRPQTNRLKLLFEDYVRNQTLANWKFWIFSFLIRPLFEVYEDSVATTSSDVFCHSVLAWLQQHCLLVSLRPAVLKALRDLSTTTSILDNPSSMPQEATQAVSRTGNSSGHSSFT